MKSTSRLQVKLVFSRWQYRIGVCCAISLGIAMAIFLHHFAQMPSVWLSAGLGALAIVLFVKLAGRQSVGHELPPLIIFAAGGLVWIGAANAAPPVDARLPELRKMQRYLGLIWLSNSAGAHALIWPDSVSTDTHRQMRIWLGIHARVKN